MIKAKLAELFYTPTPFSKATVINNVFSSARFHESEISCEFVELVQVGVREVDMADSSELDFLGLVGDGWDDKCWHVC